MKVDNSLTISRVEASSARIAPSRTLSDFRSEGRIINEMKHEYHEGPKAGRTLTKLATAVFKAPKVANPKRQPKTKPASGKNEG